MAKWYKITEVENIPFMGSRKVEIGEIEIAIFKTRDGSIFAINNIFREMYGLGFLKNYENWIKYREKRNITSHEYDRNKSYEIIEVIPGFVDDLKFLIDNLEKALGE